MIGVIVKESEKKIVEEFFELFKTPWEFYKDNSPYNVILSTQENIEIERIQCNHLIIYNSKIYIYDSKYNLHPYDEKQNTILKYNDKCLPVYGRILTFNSTKNIFLSTDKNNEAVAVVIRKDTSNKTIIRIGYDLFWEINFLLTSGQPVDCSHIPAVDLHISLLRDLILSCGVPLVEIPPVPAGYAFTVCLTHDVDFIDIRSHKFDHSVIGFLYRVVFLRYLYGLNFRISFARFLKNWKALLSLPGVYLGVFRDFWFDIDRYMEIEKDLCSTFFFIPYKNQPGEPFGNKKSRLRAARYDINNYKNVIVSLLEKGHEIGLHGIDAWCNTEKGINELKVIHDIANIVVVGVRMHWLYFSEDSPKALEDAGISYDSTRGYNETIGFLCGTTQVFRFLNSLNLFELPLNVMDTALFYSKRMKISEPDALCLCRNLINEMQTYGGVLTINWHTRSLNPERNWDDFYIELINILKAENVWFASAKQAVNWFKKRRSVHFDDVRVSNDKITIKVSSKNLNDLPHVLLRVYHPKSDSLDDMKNLHFSEKQFIDIPWAGEPEIEHTFESKSSNKSLVS